MATAPTTATASDPASDGVPTKGSAGASSSDACAR